MSVFSSEQPPWLSHLNHELSLEDLTIDEGLTHLQKVERYVSSPIPLQRLVHLKLFASTAKEHGLDVTRTVLLPLIGLLTMDDKVVVRQELPTQIILISQHFVSNGQKVQAPEDGEEEGYSLFLESLLPCIARLLHDQREEVRQAASEALVEAAQLVRPADVGRHLLTLVLRLAHDDENDSLRMTAAWLLNELSPRLGPALSYQFLLPECVSLAEDPDPRVRRHVAWNLLHIFTLLRGHKRLLDAFLGLCEDDNYRVRRACTETIADLTAALTDRGLRHGVMLKAFTQLLGSDSSHTVRTGAKLHLGSFIATLESPQVPPELVQAFVGLADEHDLRQQCAFQFPAVCFTLGAGRWSELRECFFALTKSERHEVRRTLACSFHEVARVLGAEIVESELLPVFEYFVHEPDPAISLGVTKHLADFLAVITPSWRESYLPVAEEQLAKAAGSNWRAREALGGQLEGLAALFTPELCHEGLLPILVTLLRDPVATVRQAAVQASPAYFRVLGCGDSGTRAAFTASLQKFARSPAFQQRQTYIQVCHAVLCSLDQDGAEEEEEEAEEADSSPPRRRADPHASALLEVLVPLASDPVAGVRIALAKALRHLDRRAHWTQKHPIVREIRATLERDADVQRACPLHREGTTQEPGPTEASASRP